MFLRMAKLRDLYMLVGDSGYRTFDSMKRLPVFASQNLIARNTLVHVASAAISAHATNFSAQVGKKTSPFGWFGGVNVGIYGIHGAFGKD